MVAAQRYSLDCIFTGVRGRQRVTGGMRDELPGLILHPHGVLQGKALQANISGSRSLRKTRNDFQAGPCSCDGASSASSFPNPTCRYWFTSRRCSAFSPRRCRSSKYDTPFTRSSRDVANRMMAKP